MSLNFLGFGGLWGKWRVTTLRFRGSSSCRGICQNVEHRPTLGGAPMSEEDKRATTNVQNGLVFFFSFGLLVARFARIDSHDSRESGDSRESEIRAIRANRLIRAIKIGVSIANDSRESIRANRVANRPCH